MNFNSLLKDQIRNSNNEISIYIHVPFCNSRCGYCDFNTYVLSELQRGAIDIWFHSLVKEIISASKLLNGKKIKTIFFGGGTPSFVGENYLVKILKIIKENFELKKNIEITTESNPESVNQRFVDELFQAGFNRLSMGFQSSSSRILKILDREHTNDKAIKAVNFAKKAGFKNINLDVIYGTPTETIEELEQTLNTILEAKINHVSAYSLIIEPGTAMNRKIRKGIYKEENDQIFSEKYLLIDNLLSKHDFSWYEISNWSKKNEKNAESKHNFVYWNNENWWGFGPGAHSHVGNIRFWNVKLPKKYSEKISEKQLPIADFEILTSENIFLENVMLKIRTNNGLEIEGLNSEVVEELISEELVNLINNRIVLTLKGRLFADLITRRLTD